MLNIDLQGHHSNFPVWYTAFHCPWKKQRGLCYYYSDKILKNTDRVQIFFLSTWEILSILTKGLFMVQK